MSLLKPGYVLSIAVHGVLIGGAFAMHQPAPHVFKQVAVYIPPPKQKAHKEKPPPPVVERKKPPPPPPPPPKPKHVAPTKTPEPVKALEPVQHQVMKALPDFGISMSGGLDMGAGVGVAVPTGVNPIGAGDAPSSTKRRSHKPEEKVLRAPRRKHEGPAAANCDEEATKPKAQGFVQPQYTDDARSAGIEGRVMLKLTIDTQGNVSNVQVLKGLGHGLDQSAVAAAKRMHFTPSMLCGKPQSATFVVSMRFVLGD